MTTLDTEAGPLAIVRAGAADYDAVIAILREAAFPRAAPAMEALAHGQPMSARRLRKFRAVDGAGKGVHPVMASRK